jgi:hypothetical protein
MPLTNIQMVFGAISLITLICLVVIILHYGNHGVSASAILREDEIDRWTLVLNLRNRDRRDITVEAVTVTVNGYYSGMTSKDHDTSPVFKGVELPHRLPGSSSETWTAPGSGMMQTACALTDPSISVSITVGTRSYGSIVGLAWYEGSKLNRSS